jgi:hypothetical protein
VFSAARAANCARTSCYLVPEILRCLDQASGNAAGFARWCLQAPAAATGAKLPDFPRKDRFMRTTLFSSVRAGLITAAAVAGLAASSAEAQTTLRWKFQKGEILNYGMVQKSTSKITVSGRTIEISANQTVDTTWTVKDVQPDGQAEIAQRFDRVRMIMETPASKIEYDSMGGKPLEGPQGAVLKVLVGAEVTFKMNARGEVTDVRLPEPVVKAFKEIATPGGGGILTEDGLKKSITQASLALPEEALARGKTWHQATDVPAPPVGSMLLDNAYTYQGVDSQVPGKLDRIDIVVDTAIKVAETSQVQAKIKAQDSKGFLLFDNAKGCLNESNVSQKIEMVLSAMGMEATQIQETSVITKLSKPS